LEDVFLKKRISSKLKKNIFHLRRDNFFCVRSPNKQK
jgi:hypothetical protein